MKRVTAKHPKTAGYPAPPTTQTIDLRIDAGMVVLLNIEWYMKANCI